MKFTFADCGGCRSCELACSYHLTNEFDITKAAIEITEKEGGGYQVTLYEEDTGTRRACDGCEGIEIPLCVRYCHTGETLMEYIEAMRETLKQKGAAHE